MPLTIYSVDDFLLGQRCLRRLHERLRKRRENMAGRNLEQCTVGDFVELPRESTLLHRFLEAYRIARVFRERERTANLRQIYPGRIISALESYSKSLMEIHNRSLAALDTLLESGEGALSDALLIVQGRLHFLDLLRPSPGGLKVSLLKSDAKMKDSYYWEGCLGSAGGLPQRGIGSMSLPCTC